MKQPRHVVEQWIEECKDSIAAGSGKLNDWETQFIENISERFDRTGFLSDETIEKLEQVYYKV